MSEPTLDTLRQRIEHLERAYRRWQLLGTAAVTLLVLSVLLGATGNQGTQIADTIQAKRFAVVDETGHERTVLGLSDGSPRLSFMGRTGKSRLALGLVEESPGLSLYDVNGEPRVWLTLTNQENHETPSFTLIGPDGVHKTLELSEDARGSGRLIIGGEHQVSFARIGILPEGGPYLGLTKEGKIGVVLGILHGPHIVKHNKVKTVPIRHTNKKGHTSKQQQTPLIPTPKESSLGTLVFFDKAGKEVWSVP